MSYTIVMEDEIEIQGDEFRLICSRVRGPYSHILTVDCEDGSGTATLVIEEVERLAFFLMEILKKNDKEQ